VHQRRAVVLEVVVGEVDLELVLPAHRGDGRRQARLHDVRPHVHAVEGVDEAGRVTRAAVIRVVVVVDLALEDRGRRSRCGLRARRAARRVRASLLVADLDGLPRDRDLVHAAAGAAPRVRHRRAEPVDHARDDTRRDRDAERMAKGRTEIGRRLRLDGPLHSLGAAHGKFACQDGVIRIARRERAPGERRRDDAGVQGRIGRAPVVREAGVHRSRVPCTERPGAEREHENDGEPPENDPATGTAIHERDATRAPRPVKESRAAVRVDGP